MRQTASPEVELVELGPGKHSSAAASSLDFESPQWWHTRSVSVHVLIYILHLDARSVSKFSDVVIAALI